MKNATEANRLLQRILDRISSMSLKEEIIKIKAMVSAYLKIEGTVFVSTTKEYISLFNDLDEIERIFELLFKTTCILEEDMAELPELQQSLVEVLKQRIEENVFRFNENDSYLISVFFSDELKAIESLDNEILKSRIKQILPFVHPDKTNKRPILRDLEHSFAVFFQRLRDCSKEFIMSVVQSPEYITGKTLMEDINRLKEEADEIEKSLLNDDILEQKIKRLVSKYKEIGSLYQKIENFSGALEFYNYCIGMQICFLTDKPKFIEKIRDISTRSKGNISEDEKQLVSHNKAMHEKAKQVGQVALGVGVIAATVATHALLRATSLSPSVTIASALLATNCAFSVRDQFLDSIHDVLRRKIDREINLSVLWEQDVYKYRGVVFLELKKYDDAVLDLQKYQQYLTHRAAGKRLEDNDFLNCTYNLGLALESSGKIKEAIEQFRTMLNSYEKRGVKDLVVMAAYSRTSELYGNYLEATTYVDDFVNVFLLQHGLLETTSGDQCSHLREEDYYLGLFVNTEVNYKLIVWFLQRMLIGQPGINMLSEQATRDLVYQLECNLAYMLKQAAADKNIEWLLNNYQDLYNEFMPYKIFSEHPAELEEVIEEVKGFLQSEHNLQLLEQTATDFIFPANAALRDINKEQHRQQCLIELNGVGVLLDKKNNSILEFLVKTYTDWLDSGKRISKSTLASSGIIKRGYKVLLDSVPTIMGDPTDEKACYFNKLISNLQQGEKHYELAEKKCIDRMRSIGVDYLELERKHLEEYLRLCKEPSSSLLCFSKGKESEQGMFLLEKEKQPEPSLEVYNKCGNRPKIG